MLAMIPGSQNRRWNLCVRNSGLAGIKIDPNSDDAGIQTWLERARMLERKAQIVHWNGHVPWLLVGFWID